MNYGIQSNLVNDVQLILSILFQVILPQYWAQFAFLSPCKENRSSDRRDIVLLGGCYTHTGHGSIVDQSDNLNMAHVFGH